MLIPLLDEHISPAVARQITMRRPDIQIQSVFDWRGVAFLSEPDRLILQAAAEDGLTLVTYDLKTIRPLVAEWAASGIAHAGVIFVDERTIPSDNFGLLIRAIERLWDREHHLTWTNRTKFIDRP
jgi:uncharacterized protein DUF5615